MGRLWSLACPACRRVRRRTPSCGPWGLAEFAQAEITATSSTAGRPCCRMRCHHRIWRTVPPLHTLITSHQQLPEQPTALHRAATCQVFCSLLHFRTASNACQPYIYAADIELLGSMAIIRDSTHKELPTLICVPREYLWMRFHNIADASTPCDGMACAMPPTIQRTTNTPLYNSTTKI